MKRTAGAWLITVALGGCMTAEHQPMGGCGGAFGGGMCATNVPGVQGPWGKPVAMTGPFAYAPPDPKLARAMMSHSTPLDVVQAGYSQSAGAGSGIVQAAGSCPGGACMPGMLPPGGGLAPPGMGGMGPGMTPPAGAVAAVGAIPIGAPSRFPTQRTSVRFVGPAGMKVAWYAPSADGKPGYVATQLTAPGRYNFVQAAIYRLKISNIANRPGLELYPTIEVVPSNCRTDTFLSHSAVPVSFTDEDLEQVVTGNFVVKVIYLPDPQFQDLATTGPDEVVSSRLEPGVDPIAEAKRRGCILLVVRIGNIDLEAPNTPAMDAPSPYTAKGAGLPGMPQMPGAGMGPGMGGPGPMVPYGFMQSGKPLQMGPNGPIIPPSDFPAMGAPMMPPGASVPAPSAGQLPAASGGGAVLPGDDGPISKLPDMLPPVQQTQYNWPGTLPSTAALASQQPGTLPAPTDKSVKEHWWSRFRSDDK